MFVGFQFITRKDNFATDDNLVYTVLHVTITSTNILNQGVCLI